MSSLIEFLSNQKFFCNFSEEELNEVVKYCEIIKFNKNEIIDNRKDSFSSLFFVYSGKVQLGDQEFSNNKFLSNIYFKDSYFGSLEFISNSNIKESLVILEDTVLIKFKNTSNLFNDKKLLLKKLFENITIENCRKLNENFEYNSNLIQSEIKRKIDLKKYTDLFLLKMSLIGLSFIFLQIASTNHWLELTKNNIIYNDFTILMIILIPSLYVMKRAGFGSEDIQLLGDKNKIFYAFPSAIILSAPILVLTYIIYKFDPKLLDVNYHIEFKFLVFLIMIDCFLTEFIGRSLLQSNLEKFLSGEQYNLSAFLTALVLGSSAIYISFTYCIFYIICLFIAGKFYQKYKNILASATIIYLFKIFIIYLSI